MLVNMGVLGVNTGVRESRCPLKVSGQRAENTYEASHLSGRQ